jgi:hypothetical protein
MTDKTITTVGDSKRKVFTPGIETTTTDRRQGNITDDGIELIEEFHHRVADELPGLRYLIPNFYCMGQAHTLCGRVSYKRP